MQRWTWVGKEQLYGRERNAFWGSLQKLGQGDRAHLVQATTVHQCHQLVEVSFCHIQRLLQGQQWLLRGRGGLPYPLPPWGGGAPPTHLPPPSPWGGGWGAPSADLRRRELGDRFSLKALQLGMDVGQSSLGQSQPLWEDRGGPGSGHPLPALLGPRTQDWGPWCLQPPPGPAVQAPVRPPPSGSLALPVERGWRLPGCKGSNSSGCLKQEGKGGAYEPGSPDSWEGVGPGPGASLQPRGLW